MNGTPGCARVHGAGRHVPACPCYQPGLHRPATPSLAHERPGRTLILKQVLNHAITALSMLVNTLSFMCSDPTAVMTVRLLTDTTNAVPSTSTRESREPLLAARCTPCESLPSVAESSSMPRRWTRASACFEN